MESNATPVKKKPKKPEVPRFRKQTADKDGIISKQYDASNIGSYIKELGQTIKSSKQRKVIKLSRDGTDDDSEDEQNETFSFGDFDRMQDELMQTYDGEFYQKVKHNSLKIRESLKRERNACSSDKKEKSLPLTSKRSTTTKPNADL